MKKAKKPVRKAPVLKQVPAQAVPKHRFWPYGLLLFVVLLLIDQYTKSIILSIYAPNQSVKIFNGLWFTYVQNRGISWGLLQGINEMMIWLSVIAFGLLIFFYEKFETTLEKICLTLIFAGLWGNLLDRGVHGFVVDFIDVHWFPYVFNIADSCITVAIVILLLEQWKRSRAKA